MLDLEQKYIDQIKSILGKYFTDEKIIIYGSRAKGKAHPNSDIDIAVLADEIISIEKLSFIDDEFSESDIPYTVDLTDMNRIDDSFKKIILNEGIPVPLHS